MIDFDTIDRIRESYRNGTPPGNYTTLDQRAMVGRLKSSPLLREWARKCERGTPRVESVADVLGERQMWMIGLASGVDFERIDGPAQPLPLNQRMAFANAIEATIPYLWTHQAVRMAEASPLPRHVISREVLPYPCVWWTYETASAITPELSELGVLGYDNDVSVLIHATDQIDVYSLGSRTVDDRNSPNVANRFSIKYGLTYPDDFSGLELKVVTQVLSMLAFAASPYLTLAKRRPTRPERRAMARAGSPERPQDEVTFVDLRSIDSVALDRGASESIERDFRWMVRAHYRAQWYPSEHAHRVIWISPYLKGPVDAPIRQSVYRVIR